GNLAQRVSDYMDVGDKLWLRGRIKNRQYTDDDGVVRSISEVHGRELKMIWTKNKSKSLGSESADFEELDSEFFESPGENVSGVVEERLS
ncbi:MAG: single-stranded DNA-binding protein, partial [Alcaligenaceae bacterium]|nr:single-stranded DNA-binding protein [Alcaligenaceae bacterium]